MNKDCFCSGVGCRQPSAILFNILSNNNNNAENDNISYRAVGTCHCQARQVVCVTNAAQTCATASAVLVKTVRFMKSLPSFQQLPPCDRLALLRGSWAPLFILGLAQEGVDFQVEDMPRASMLKRILLNEREQATGEDHQPTLAAVHKLKACLHKFWCLDLSPKEYAYLKGTVLFNPDVPDLNAFIFIEGLQQEAQLALREVLLPLHPKDQGRFGRILLAASSLKTIPSSLVTELFFRPIIGQTDLLELLEDMLFTW